jgi:hypothetical protein
MSCTNNGPIQGGLITESRIADSKISDSEITNSTFDNGAITGGVRLDEESATDIAAATADKVLNTLEVSGADIVPAAKMELPTSVVGDRSALMGKPAGYIKIKGYLIPVYKTGE